MYVCDCVMICAGELNKGFYYLMNELPQERLALAGGAGVTSIPFNRPYCAVSSSEACFEITRKYVQERRAFGGVLSFNVGV